MWMMFDLDMLKQILKFFNCQSPITWSADVNSTASRSKTDCNRRFTWGFILSRSLLLALEYSWEVVHFYGQPCLLEICQHDMDTFFFVYIDFTQILVLFLIRQNDFAIFLQNWLIIFESPKKYWIVCISRCMIIVRCRLKVWPQYVVLNNSWFIEWCSWFHNSFPKVFTDNLVWWINMLQA